MIGKRILGLAIWLFSFLALGGSGIGIFLFEAIPEGETIRCRSDYRQPVIVRVEATRDFARITEYTRSTRTVRDCHIFVTPTEVENIGDTAPVVGSCREGRFLRRSSDERASVATSVRGTITAGSPNQVSIGAPGNSIAGDARQDQLQLRLSDDGTRMELGTVTASDERHPGAESAPSSPPLTLSCRRY